MPNLYDGESVRRRFEWERSSSVRRDEAEIRRVAIETIEAWVMDRAG